MNKIKKRSFKKPDTTQKISLPKGLMTDIELLPLKKLYKDRVIKYASNLIRKSMEINKIAYGEASIPTSWTKKVLTKDFETCMKLMKQAQIVFCDEKWANFDDYKRCKRYWINPKYFLETEEETSVEVDFEVLESKKYMLVDGQVSYKSCTITPDMLDDIEETVVDLKVRTTPERKLEIASLQKKEKKSFKQEAEKLKRDKEKLVKEMEYKIDSYTMDSILVDEQIEVKGAYIQYGDWLLDKIKWQKANGMTPTVIKKGYKSKSYSKIAVAIEKARKMKKNIVQDGNKFYCVDAQYYLRSKKRALRLAYTEAINKLVSGDFYAHRNKVNNRLDTNFTNLPKVLMDVICKDNDLIQIDLKNSQFAIFSHLIDKELTSEASELFKKSAREGVFYELIQATIGSSSRKIAKNNSFELMFAKAGLVSENKEKLREAFEEIINYIDDYKRTHKYKNFSIMLQKYEAFLFIDNIHESLNRAGLTNFTKHDSIICKREDYEKVMRTINKVFEELEFKGTLDVEF